jgi:hypothetical protein
MKASLHEDYPMISQWRSQVFVDGDYGVYREENFIEMLAFERKRSERSGRSFLLMTLNIFFGISDLQSRHDTIRGAVEALSVFSRETDIKGWYRRASVLGVIFTETDNIDTKTLSEKIYQRLRAHLTKAQVDAIHISFHTYPVDESAAIPESPGDFTFYPDFHKERSKMIDSSLRSE